MTEIEWWYECPNEEAFPLVRKNQPEKGVRAYEDCPFQGYVWGDVEYDTLVVVCPECDFEEHINLEHE